MSAPPAHPCRLPHPQAPRARLLGVLLCAAAAGCTEQECASLAMTEPVVEVGIGEDTFQSLLSGDPAPFVFGPQGGYHVWGALRTQGLHGGREPQLGEDNRPLIDFSLLIDGQEHAHFTTGPRFLAPRDGEYRGLEGALVILDVAEPLELDDTVGLLRVRVDDICGRGGSDEREVLLQAPMD